MDSKIVVRNNLSKSKNKYYSKMRLSKSKLDDIDLGSTIGDIYRRSKTKSANTFKKRSNNTFKTKSANNFNSRNKVKFALKSNTMTKIVTLNSGKTSKIIRPNIVKKNTTNTNNIRKYNESYLKPNSKITSLKNLPNSKPDKSQHTKAHKSSHRKSEKSTHAKAFRSPQSKPDKPTYKKPEKSTHVKAYKSPHRKAEKSKHKIIQNKKIIKKQRNEYREIAVKTNLDNFKNIDNLVDINIFSTDFTNKDKFEQFTNAEDIYLMRALSAGLDISKYDN